MRNDAFPIIFTKDASELEAKLNGPSFVPFEYAITQLTFQCGEAAYLVILEREGFSVRTLLACGDHSN